MLLKNQPSVCSDLLASLDTPEFCDIKIQSPDGDVPANKAILSIRSDYFSRMFSTTNNFVESSSRCCKLPYPKAVVKKVVTYLYSGEMDVSELGLGQLLDLLELLNLMNFTEDFKKVESYAVNRINMRKFQFSECLKNLDKCFAMRMDTVGETLISYLRYFPWDWCQLEEIADLSETMLIRLLQENLMNLPDLEYGPAIMCLKTFVTWLSANSMEADKKDEVLELFDFHSFTAEELTSVVSTSGLYSSDKIIKRLGQLCKGNEEQIDQLKVELEEKDDDIDLLNIEMGALAEELKVKDYEIDHLEEELRREENIFEFELSTKDNMIYKLTRKQELMEKALSNKRKIEDPTSNEKGKKWRK